MRSHFREMGMAELLYYYGGMVLPNSFLCLKNLKDFYKDNVSQNRPFVCEAVNHTSNVLKQKQKLLFVPDLYIMGANKNDPVILQLVEFLKARNKSPLFTSEAEFVGDSSQWCLEAIRDQKLTLVSGDMVGVKTADRKTILLENLMEEAYLDLNKNAVGIYIPGDEILRRNKYQWFAYLPSELVISAKMIISKYLMASISDSTGDYKPQKKENDPYKSVVAI
jgi:hypothetical protein